MRGHILIGVLLLAIVAAVALFPVALGAQESSEEVPADNNEEALEEISFWEREMVGLQLKTWAVIVVLVIIIFVVLEGFGWLLALIGIGALLWLLLR